MKNAILCLAVLVAGCATPIVGIEQVSQPYRGQIEGMAAGRIDPWGVPISAWPETEEGINAARFLSDLALKAQWQAKRAEQFLAPLRSQPRFTRGYSPECYDPVWLTTYSLRNGYNYGDDGVLTEQQYRAVIETVRGERPALLAKIAAARAPRPEDGPNPIAREAVARNRAAETTTPNMMSSDAIPAHRGAMQLAEYCRLNIENAPWLHRHLERGLLLDRARDGDAAVAAGFAMAMRAPRDWDLLEKVAPLYLVFARDGVIDAEVYAELVDAVAFRRGRPAVYGAFLSCTGWVSNASAAVPGPAIDEAAVTQARTAIGLSSFEVWRARLLKEVCAVRYPFSM